MDSISSRSGVSEHTGVVQYDKRGYVFLGTVTAAAVVIWLRS
ncbi:hypothetical protein [Streptomyces sp. NPDC007355]